MNCLYLTVSPWYWIWIWTLRVRGVKNAKYLGIKFPSMQHPDDIAAGEGWEIFHMEDDGTQESEKWLFGVFGVFGVFGCIY